MVPRACNTRILKIIFRYSTFKHFCVCSAAMKSFSRILSQWWNAFCVCSASDEIRSTYAQHILNDVFEMGSDFLLCWACTKIGFLLAEHAWKLVTCWLSRFGNWLLVGWVSAENRFYWYWSMFFPLSSVLLYPFSFSCLTSYVSCLKCLFLVSHPLFPVSPLCSLFHVHCSLSPFPFSLLCSLFPALCLPSSVPRLTSLFLVSHPLFRVSLLCSLSPVLCSQSYVSVPCLPFSFPNLKSLFLYPILLSR
jgi:hypothetical protein